MSIGNVSVATNSVFGVLIYASASNGMIDTILIFFSLNALDRR